MERTPMKRIRVSNSNSNMNKMRCLFLIAILSGLGTTCIGQFHLPSLDVQVKSGAAALIDMQDYYSKVVSSF